MPSTYTSRGYELMATGEKVDTWGTVTNSNLSLITQNLSGNLAVSTTGGTTTLTDSQAANVTFTVSGTLTSNATIVFPDRGGFYFVSNGTSGAFTLTAKTNTGSGVTLQQGAQTLVYSDGTNMLYGNNSGSTFVTADLIDSFGPPTARSGWVICNTTTIGSASSGASQRANPDCQALYYHLWGLGFVPTGGRGASAAADWSANKPIPTPDMRGNVRAGLDGMGTTAAGRLTSTTITGGADTAGNSGGAQTITLTSAQMPSHIHGATADVAGDHYHPDVGGVAGPFTGGGVIVAQSNSGSHNTGNAGSHTHTITVAATGGGGAHNNVQPTMVVTVYIKL